MQDLIPPPGSPKLFIPPCNFCHKQQTKYGGMLWSPPRDEGWCLKWHVCVDCYQLLTTLVAKLLDRSGVVAEG